MVRQVQKHDDQLLGKWDIRLHCHVRSRGPVDTRSAAVTSASAASGTTNEFSGSGSSSLIDSGRGAIRPITPTPHARGATPGGASGE